MDRQLLPVICLLKKCLISKLNDSDWMISIIASDVISIGL